MNYDRPKKTYTDYLNEVLQNQGFNAPSIQEKLKRYSKITNLSDLKKDDHVRYFIWDNKDDKLKFRTGGFIKIINDNYFILTNKKFNWSVQKKIKSQSGIVYRTLFYKKNYINNENINNENINNENNNNENIIININKANMDSDCESENTLTNSESENDINKLNNLSRDELIKVFLNNYC